MESKVNLKTLLPKFNLSEKEEEQYLDDCLKVNVLLNSETWQRIKLYWDIGREGLIDAIKVYPKTETEMRRIALMGSVLKGYDEFMRQLVNMSNDYLNHISKKQEDQNDGNEEDQI